MLRLEICISSKNLCCDLKFSHHNFIHYYPSCDLDNLLRPRKFPGLLEQFNSQQVQFTKSNQNKYNSIHIHHSNTQRIRSTMHQIQNWSTKLKKNSPKLSITLYRKQNSINHKRVYYPLLSLVQIGSLNVEIPLCVHSYCPTRNIRNLKQQ